MDTAALETATNAFQRCSLLLAAKDSPRRKFELKLITDDDNKSCEVSVHFQGPVKAIVSEPNVNDAYGKRNVIQCTHTYWLFSR
ncbi:unnamed protein product [Nippostrongylus brasiliensis]|uniref:Uncharacterized protein n=1 Tax=Nippostrongylus brasiliensis TaxID=27835 RepID=A0A0N4YVR3_NIPBR|nr:unnamed protein product [Nippostrongylus brasiliensis]